MNSSQGELLPIQSHPRFRLISLFAGAGGFTLGFTKEFNHHFELVWANDINQDTVSTFNANFAQPCVLGDLAEILKDSNIEIPIADVVIGSPPNQAFSACGKKIESDSRQQLWQLFFEVVERSKAQIFVMQYNHGSLHPRFSSQYKDILKAIEALGFNIAQRYLCATDFGVPQLRRRVFLIGCRFADPTKFFPPKTHSNPNDSSLLSQLAPWRTVRDAIADLPPPEDITIRNEPPPLDLHFGYRHTQQILERYQAALNSNQLYRMGIRQLRWDEPASVINPQFFPGKWRGYLHPEQDRPITHREAARLQSFPDSFRFCGTSYTIAQQIGYAVPPLLAAPIANSVYTLLSSRKELENANAGQLVLSSQQTDAITQDVKAAPLPANTPPPEPSEQILQINTEVNANPQLRQLKQESNSKAWNCLVDWIAESVCEVNFDASEASVQRLQHSYQGQSPREIARVLIVQKSLQAAGVDLVRGIPGAEAVIWGIAKYNLPEITKLSAEMVYQIADIYGFDLQAPERKVEALTAFGAAFLGEQAIEAGIDWLECGLIPRKIISASAKALMIYAVGNAACLFYEAKLNARANPLTSPKLLNEIRKESQHYLDDATSEEAIVNIISNEINTALTIDYTRLGNLLKAKDWKKADQETRDIVVKIANRDFGGNLRILPREDLRTINQLWLNNSNGHFGFSVQKQIYLDLSKKVGDFGEKVGWRGEAGMFGGIFGWKSYGWLTFNLNNAPKGHLPAFPLDMPWWYHKGETTKDFAQSILERNDW